MFQSVLKPKEAQLSNQVLTSSLEKCFEEVQVKLALVERSAIAREAFASIPDKEVTSLTVSMFASAFSDVDQQFIPEVSQKSLESSLASSGTEAKAFALESGDGIIARIWKFIKDLIAKIVGFVKNLFVRSKEASQKSSEKSKAAQHEFYSLLQKTKPSSLKVPKTLDMAPFIINSKIDFGTMDKVIQEMYENIGDAIAAMLKFSRLKGEIDRMEGSELQYSVQTVLSSFVKVKVGIYPDSDFPGKASAYFDDSEERKKFEIKFDSGNETGTIATKENIDAIDDWIVSGNDISKFTNKTKSQGLRELLDRELLPGLTDLVSRTQALTDQLENQIFVNNRKAVAEALTKHTGKTSAEIQEELTTKNHEVRLKISAFKEFLFVVNSFTALVNKISVHVHYIDHSNLGIYSSVLQELRNNSK